MVAPAGPEKGGRKQMSENNNAGPVTMQAMQRRMQAMQTELDHYHGLELAGLLVTLPCKVGTPVYVVAAARENGRAWLGVNKTRFRLSDVEKWGKTVFATRDEAMAAAALRGVSELK